MHSILIAEIDIEYPSHGSILVIIAEVATNLWCYAIFIHVREPKLQNYQRF